MRLVFVTQQVDPGDPVLGATVAKLRALAARVDEVAVLAAGAVPGALPASCRVRRFGAPTRAGRGLRFAVALGRELARRPRPVAIVAHMCPIYAVLAAPLARPLRVPVVLWYAHWRRTRLLEAAVRASDLVVSVDARSIPVATPKGRGIGHGIDVREFPCGPERGDAGGPLRALALGRYSPAKGLDVVVRAVAAARAGGEDVRLACYGTAQTDEERRERASLWQLVRALGLAAEHVQLGEAVPRSRVPELHLQADVLVNNMRAGAPDKAVYEACASCLPVLASNPVFDELLEGLEPPLRFGRERPEELADRLAALARTPPAARHALGATLRERVLARHSVDTWADALLELVRRP
jgi:glycosyltransferase involved in cell wall biosynthesis